MTEGAEPLVIRIDTCDHCGPGVIAYVWASKGEQELSYCGHCGTKYKTKLMQWADVVHDLTYTITSR